MKNSLLFIIMFGCIVFFANEHSEEFCQVDDPKCNQYESEIYGNLEKFLIYSIDACENKQDLAYCYNLGVLLSRNRLYEDAKKYYEQVCNKDYAHSCYNLGFLAEFEKNAVLTRKYFQKACNLGIKESCDELKRLEND